jgi:NAD(P)-dependent dehydrogenase (short-subunit alcohol dehydrogenase family)
LIIFNHQKEANKMKDKICMVTGATSGIGKATAMGLAKMGASIVLVGRDRERGEAARDEIRNLSRNPKVDLLLADLSSQAAIRQLVVDYKAQYTQLHVLVNNAGVAPIKRMVTVDGIETTFAINYLAPFLLTNLLLDTIKGSAPARIVNVAGDFHRKATIHFDDLMSEKEYNNLQANNQAKLALILFTYELARRLTGTNVTVNCLHPGAVATDAPLKDPNLSSFSRLMYKLVRLFFLSPEKGAETSIFLASSPDVEGVTGKYFIKKLEVASSPESYNQEIAERLWEESTKLTGLA